VGDAAPTAGAGNLLAGDESYGSYILTTGGGITAGLEELMGRYLYRTRFAGRSRVLDLAPGRCWFTRQDPARIVALDIQPAVVEHYARAGLDIRLGDANAMPFPDASFDAVFCCWLFEHLPDPERAMAEIRRVLMPGGYACIIVPSKETLATHFYDDYTHIRPFTKVSLAQLAKAAGFTRLSADYLYYARFVRYVIQFLGQGWAYRYVRLMDTTGRELRVVNRENLMLEVWK